MDENLIEITYNMLLKSDKPGNVITHFFCRIFGVEFSRSYLIMFNKFIKLYGRTEVLFSVVDVSMIPKVNPKENLYPLFNSILQRRFNRKYKEGEFMLSKDMTNELRKIKRELQKVDVESLDLTSPFEENE